MKAMLLSAGLGSRLNPYTLQKPKPLVPFMGVPLGCYSLALLEDLDVHSLVINVHHLADQVEDFFRDLRYRKLPVVFSDERKELLGSGGGIHNAEEYLTGKKDFIVMNGDEVILPHNAFMMRDFWSYHKNHGGIATLLTMDHPEVGKKFGGAWVNENNLVQQFAKTNPSGNVCGKHFLGVLILKESIFNYFNSAVTDENILYETLTKAIQAGEKVYAYDCKTEWFETGNPEDFIRATEYCLNEIEKYPNELEAPVWLIHLLRTIRGYHQGDAMIEKDHPAVYARLKQAYSRLQLSFP